MNGNTGAIPVLPLRSIYLISVLVRFSADAVEVNAAAAEGGKVKFTVTPSGGLGTSRPTRFFFKVKMK